MEERCATPETGSLAGAYIWRGEREKDKRAGIWTGDGRREPKLWIEGTYDSPAISSDGEWIAVLKEFPGNTPRKESLVLIHGKDRWEFPVESSTPAPFVPIAWVPIHRKFLLRNQRYFSDAMSPNINDDGVYRLLDPLSRETAEVTGEFRPILKATNQPLQHSTASGEYWAALPAPDAEPPATIVGRYVTANFKFQPVLTIPDVSFSSHDMWIDEAARTVTFVANGDVLRLALP